MPPHLCRRSRDRCSARPGSLWPRRRRRFHRASSAAGPGRAGTAAADTEQTPLQTPPRRAHSSRDTELVTQQPRAHSSDTELAYHQPRAHSRFIQQRNRHASVYSRNSMKMQRTGGRHRTPVWALKPGAENQFFRLREPLLVAKSNLSKLKKKTHKTLCTTKIQQK